MEDLGSTNGTYVNGRQVEGVAPIGFGDELQIGQVRMRLERAAAMTSSATGATARGRAAGCPRILGPIRPRPRWRELRLLGLVAAGARRRQPRRWAPDRDRHARALRRASSSSIYLAALLAAHLAQVLAGRRTDQVLLPAVGLLGGISLLLMERLPQDLVTQRFFGAEAGPGRGPAGLAGRCALDRSPRRSGSSSAPTAGCAATSTRGRRPASACCC